MHQMKIKVNLLWKIQNDPNLHDEEVRVVNV